MMTTSLNAPHVGDVVHYWPMLSEMPGCRAAIVTEMHVDPHLASLMILHTTGLQFLTEVRQSESDPLSDPYVTEKYVPGTWHAAGHQ